MDCNKVGKLISNLRKEKGMTQKILADKMNISDRTISKGEKGKIIPLNFTVIKLYAIMFFRRNRGYLRTENFHECYSCISANGNNFYSYHDWYSAL